MYQTVECFLIRHFGAGLLPKDEAMSQEQQPLQQVPQRRSISAVGGSVEVQRRPSVAGAVPERKRF